VLRISQTALESAVHLFPAGPREFPVMDLELRCYRIRESLLTSDLLSGENDLNIHIFRAFWRPNQAKSGSGIPRIFPVHPRPFRSHARTDSDQLLNSIVLHEAEHIIPSR
jgi:hypothetical protein